MRKRKVEGIMMFVDENLGIMFELIMSFSKMISDKLDYLGMKLLFFLIDVFKNERIIFSVFSKFVVFLFYKYKNIEGEIWGYNVSDEVRVKVDEKLKRSGVCIRIRVKID